MKHRMKITHRFSPWAWMVFIITIVILISINYAGTEGLNPSDDGVVLAQSWRLLQGEIPHQDFISIRPVGSGVLHTINFLFPFPLEITARYFVLFQFFIITVCWVQFFRLNSTFKHNLPISYQASILFIAWMIGLYNYNLFSWTTIDAIFWASIGLYMVKRGLNNRRKLIPIAIGLFAFVMSALSRQTFALLCIFGWVWTAYALYRQKAWKTVIIAAIFGATPILAYAIVIALNNAGGAFIQQLTGRSQFYEPAIRQYWDMFKADQLLYVHIGIILFSIGAGIMRKSSHRIRAKLASLPTLRTLFIAETFLVVYFLYATLRHFLTFEMENFAVPFLGFWILLDMLMLNLLVQENRMKHLLPGWAALLTAWVSSISLGCQTPVFAMGILTTSILWLFLKKYQDVLLLKQKWLRIFLPALAIAVGVISIKSQQEVNYRDVGKSSQTHNLNDINPVFGNIMTNENTFKYFKEADSIISSLQKQDFPFSIMPDNAILYPLYRIHNPLSIDWAQAGEMVMQKDTGGIDMNDPFNLHVLYRSNEQAIFVVQKFASKSLKKGFIPLNDWAYLYFKIIKEDCKMIYETEYFEIYQKDKEDCFVE